MAMTPKELKALAAACRKAGIQTYKGDGVEFTLEPITPKPRRRVQEPKAAMIEVQGPQGPVKIAAPVKTKGDDIETEELSPEALLFWSVADESDQEAN